MSTMDSVASTQLNPQEHVITIYTPSTSAPNPNPNPNPRSGTNTNTNTGTGTYNRNRRSPLNSGLWISIEVIVNVSQIIASIIVLTLSRNEKPKAPLFEWVIGYTVGCFATLPHLYWRYIHRNVNNSNHNNNQNNNGQGVVQNNDTGQMNDLETATNNNNNNINNDNNNNNNNSRDVRERQLNVVASNPRINALFDHFKMALDCFFAVWFVVGNVWIFGTHSSAADAPTLYRLCIVFLTFSCIGYAMPFILCGVICCCLPCIISVMGFREDAAQSRGATSESINALPTYKFKTNKKPRRAAEREAGHEGAGGQLAEGGGVFAPGTDKEKILSAEDAVCCICLGKYTNNDELRELPCTHFFHKDCVDKWLKINALCPLCKAEVGNNHPSSS